jgi:methyl-accepting chemotaxis protein
MVPSIRKTADLVQEIAAASTEQTAGVNQINAAIGQVSQTMQQNAAAAEELSSTSEELSSQALRLQEAVSYFTLSNQDSRPSYSRAPRANVQSQPQPRKKADKKMLSDDDLDKDFVRYS